MKVTREVITDLLPVYFSGEASPDTGTLVEEFFKRDPEFARLAQDERSRTMLNPLPVNLPPEHEKITLARTKALLWLRTLLLAFAIFFSLIPFTFYFDDSRVHQVPLLVNSSIWIWLAALGCWIGFFVTLYRLRTTRH
jgi:hypothetical protein